jgi:hypothetical protein
VLPFALVAARVHVFVSLDVDDEGSEYLRVFGVALPKTPAASCSARQIAAQLSSTSSLSGALSWYDLTRRKAHFLATAHNSVRLEAFPACW